MELPPEHINDWLCAAQVPTALHDSELFEKAREPDFIPDVIAARNGSVFPRRSGLLCVMFELVQLTYPEAEDEAQSVIDAATIQMHIPPKDTVFEIDVRPLTNPYLIALPPNVHRLNDYRKRNFKK